MHGSFVHLHCHSHYSLLDSTATIDQLVARTKELGMNALALTDTGNLHGALEFYAACKAAGIKPIIGYEALVVPDRKFLPRGRRKRESCHTLTLLAQDRTGFDSLRRLSTEASLNGDGLDGIAVIDGEFLKSCNMGLICISGGTKSELWEAFYRTTCSDDALEYDLWSIANWFKEVFGDRFFVEIQDSEIDEHKPITEVALEFARKVGIPVVATCDCHYLAREDAKAHDALLSLAPESFAYSGRWSGAGDLWLKSPQEMYAAFKGCDRGVIAEAVNRSQVIADSVSLEIDLGKRHFPSVEVPSGRTPLDKLRHLCLEGLRERYATIPKRWADGKTPSSGGTGELHGEVLTRLETELDVIGLGGAADVFLVVGDMVREAQKRGIPVAARGMCASSLILYGLWCSHVCVFEHDLLLEHFLARWPPPGHPTIDIDVCQERRGELIDYLRQKYGPTHVAHVALFVTRHARAAIRDGGRVIGMTLPQVSDIVDLVPSKLGITLSEASLPGTPLADACDANAEVANLVDLAKRIEGLVRDVGIRGTAVVIADRPLVDYVPLCRVERKEEILTQWGVGDVERAGLMKMGLLGVRHLTVMSKTLDSIEAHSGVRPNPLGFPLDDDAAFALIARGDTEGVFQLESDGIRGILRRMKPDRFLDLVAINALYSPGPHTEGMLDEYIDMKHGRRQAADIHPFMEKVLAETYGVIVYEEQVLRLLERLGGINLCSAGVTITGVRDEDPTVRAELRTQFIQGAQGVGFEVQQAAEVFAFIERHALHAFNKSHAVAYGLLTWQTAYLRTHFPEQYLAAARA